MEKGATARLPGVRSGRFEVTGLLDGFMHLDGGAMHGTVPKVLWQTRHPSDDRNRIRLGLRGLLVRGPGLTAVVETGLGSHHDSKFGERYGVVQPPTLIESLDVAGVRPVDVDLVINTHLHWDHAGGNVTLDVAGRPVPTFPRAEYVAQRLDWEEATHLHERNRGSYRSEDFQTIAEAGRLRLVDGDVEVVPGIRVEQVGGHTIGMQIVVIGDGPSPVVFLADMAPTAAHLDYPWVMGYDLYPVDTLMSKKRILPRAVAEDWIVAFVHDPEVAFGRVRLGERDRPTLASL